MKINSMFKNDPKKFQDYKDAVDKKLGKTENIEDDIDEDMNAILAKAGEEKHGEKYMDAAREKAQEKGRKLTADERDQLRDKHSDNRKDEDISDIARLAGL